ncbi:hypothetical protein [Serratia sp. Nf2]|nr:hypothetical protein [Serratia sp. Nf2]
MTLKLTDYQARLLYSHLCALTDAGAETLTEKELAALEELISKLREGQ